MDTSFLGEVEARSGESMGPCYQCLKCTVGCPVSGYMDFKPNQVIRMVQYGQRDRVLKSHAIWLCVSCMTCGTRCPNEVDMSAVFDTLREMSIEAGYSHKAERNVVLLHEEFVRSVKLWGRLHEVTFFIPYMMRSMDLLSNMVSGITLMLKGKLPLIPKRIKGATDIKKLYGRAHKTKGQLSNAVRGTRNAEEQKSSKGV